MTTEQKTLSRWNKRGMDKFSAENDVDLTGGTTVNDVFKSSGVCRILCMYLEITTACENKVCNMSWIFDSDLGGNRVIGNTVNIANSALGDYYVAELDGTNIIKVTTATGVPHGYFYEHSTTNGTIVTNGGIDVVLSATLATGAGKLYVYYKPLMWNACISPQ